MYDIEQAKQRQHDYYLQDDYLHGINQITEFNFEDPALVPELFRNFAVEYFNLERYRRVDLDELNRVLNDLWDGPGSAAKISDIIWDIRIRRREDPRSRPQDVFKGYVTPTVDSELEAQDDRDE